MSSFKGRMRLYTNLCIDRFDGNNLKCTAFFLSHCHKDHMVGLDDKKFKTCLSSRQEVFLYCSEITLLLLLADEEYKPLEKFIKVLEVGAKHTIQIPDDHVGRGGCEVAVTLISAGHCPGSVMFLFEGNQGNCLYTGDFRWEPNYASTVAAFKMSHRLKEIEHLHIDTTFCVPAALHIPSRVECVDATLSLVAMWLERSPRHQVAFFCPARYGYEFLLREVATRLGYKVHVSSTKYSLYEQIPDLCGLFTSDPKEARIHACCPKLKSNASIFPPCLSRAVLKRQIDEKGQETYQVMNIRPCAMWFTTKTGQAALKRLNPKSPKGLKRVCYSMHSSYSEIEDLVSYLQPRYVWPNVIPASDHGVDQVQSRLNSFLKRSHPLRPKVNSFEGMLKDATVTANIDLLSTELPKETSSLFNFVPNDSDSSDGCVFDSPDSASGDVVAHEAAVRGNPSHYKQLQPPEADKIEKEDKFQVYCPDVEGEEADSDLHLRLSQDSEDSSQDSQQTLNTAQGSRHSSLHSQQSREFKNCFLRSEICSEPVDMYKNIEDLSDCETSLKSKFCPNKASNVSSLRAQYDLESRSAGQAENLPHFSSKKSHNGVTNFETKRRDVSAGQVLLCDKSLSDEEEEDVIDSSPQFKSKAFISLLKGRLVKVSSRVPCHDPPSHAFPSVSEDAPLSHPSRSTEKKCELSSSNISPCTESDWVSQVSVRRQILNFKSSEVLSTKDSLGVGEYVNSQHSKAKRAKLSSESECVLNNGRGDPIQNEQTGQDFDTHYKGKVIDDDVCVIPSDSEDTDEDSEKMLKPQRKAVRNSVELQLKTNYPDFIDLT